MKALKTFFNYYGGKYRLAPRYPRPRWGTIVEPFAGSAGYSVRYHNRRVVLYDLNPQVVGTWDYLIRTSARDILSLPLVFDDVRDLSICQEAKWLIGWWINKGTASPCCRPSSRMKSNRRPHSHWGTVIRLRLARQVECIRHWKVTKADYTDADCGGKATWFIDPPYQRSGYKYPYRDVDYLGLKGWVQRLSGQVIACGQEGDDWLDFRPFCTTRSMNGFKLSGTSKEVIWTNDGVKA